MAPAWRLARVAGDLMDLVLPEACAGCARSGERLRRGVCRDCARDLRRLSPAPTRPSPAPPGLPPLTAFGPYQGALRGTLLAYKERGRHRLAGPLGALLAEAVAVAVPAGPLLLVPVPSTARAARQRHGDHMVRVARHAAVRLRQAGRPAALHSPLRAVDGPDSAGLGAAERLAVARDRFRPRTVRRSADRTGRRRSPTGAEVVVVDDIVTTGATLAAMAGVLADVGLPVAAGAVLAATRRHARPGYSVRPMSSR